MAGPDAARRIEIGAARRQRTREAIIAGALETVAHARLDDLTIDDFIASAKVARGTFYNHFRTKEDLLNAMAAHVADAVDTELNAVFEGVDDPVRRISIAIREFVRICTERPSWGWVLVRSSPDVVGGWNQQMRAGALDDIRRATQRGTFVTQGEEAVVAVAIGSLREGIRMALTMAVPDDFGAQLAALTLRAMGMSPRAAQRAASAEIKRSAPTSPPSHTG